VAAASAQPGPVLQAPVGGYRSPAAIAKASSRVSTTRVIIGLFIGVTAALLGGVGGQLASPVYVLVAVIVGIILIFRTPTTYASFTLWLWFVTPFVRRVLDMHHGWNPTNPCLLAPPLVSMLGLLMLSRYARELRGMLFAPFLLAIAALAYGFSIGTINSSLLAASYSLLTWLAPIVFGIFLAASWRRYPELTVSVRRAYAIALPVLALYGVYQFVRLPAWDAGWMRNADMRSLGPPLPLLLRVFGTLNAPGPYASFLVAGMIVLLPAKGWLRYPAIAIAAISLLLTRTRAVWIAFIIGLVISQLSQPILRLPKRTITMLVIALLALPFAATPQFKNTILPRLNTLTDLRDDNSFIKRVQFSQETASGIVESAEGSGLGTTGGAVKLRNGQGVRSLDNGFLEVFYVLGWPGGALFFMGIGILVLQAFRFAEPRKDSFANSARATAIALISVLPIGDVFTGPTGTFLWSMVGLGIAAHTYHLTLGREARVRDLQMRMAARPSSPGVPVPAVLVPARSV
jgi:hypothetical protein